MNNEARRSAVNRALRGMPPKPEAKEPELNEEEVPFLVFSEDVASQFSAESNLKDGEDVVIYIKSITFHPEALKNLAAASKTPMDRVRDEKGYFLLCNIHDAGDIMKALWEESAGLTKKEEEKK
jgi:hypothetical protein